MGIKESAILLWANQIRKQVKKDAQLAITHQQKIQRKNIQSAISTAFGKDHHFKDIYDYDSFKQAIPIRNYEKIASYIQRAGQGETDVLWKGRPLYWAKTSGTTSGTKYIPITEDSLPNHLDTARNMLFCYMAEKKSAAAVGGKMIFLSGSPKMSSENGIPVGRLSGIVHNHIPSYLQKNRLPCYETNCIPTWEEKLSAIVAETSNVDMRLISGIPPWVQMYFDRLMDNTRKSIRQLFPNLQVFVHGGVNILPYLPKLKQSIGATIDFLESFPASEGFLAFQDSLHEEGLLLNTNSNIFFEFIPISEIHQAKPKRYDLSQVELHKNYAIILTTNAGLWAYDIGDIVSFVSLNPFRVIVKGRTKHFISAFGEHVIAEEVESVLAQAAKEFGFFVKDFTVAPHIDTQQASHSCHEWYIEFERVPHELPAIAERMDELLCQKNAYYDDLIRGKIISPLKIIALQKDTFIQYMKAIGKLGEQNKVPHLSNDRIMVEHPSIRQGVV